MVFDRQLKMLLEEICFCMDKELSEEVSIGSYTRLCLP